MSVAFAREERERFRRQVREGSYQAKQKRVAAKTVKDLYSLYMADAANRGIKDPRRWEIAWAHLAPHFASTAATDVSTAQIAEYIAARKKDGKAPGTINRELTLLRAIFRHGTRQTPVLVDRVPAFPSRLREGAPRQGFVTEEQYRLLAANAKELWLRALIACAFAFGFRKSELLNLRVKQIDLLHRWIELEQGTTKNDEGRKVKMTGEVFALLSECVRGKSASDFVFTRADGSRVGDPRKAWYNLCVACKLGTLAPAETKRGYRKYSGLLLHDFRRAAVRNLVRRGVPEVVAMKVSGHKTRAVFDRYNIVSEADLIRATELLEGDEAGGSMRRTDTKTHTAHVRPS